MAAATESNKEDEVTAMGKASGAWCNELSAAEKELKKFWTRGRKVIKAYMDEASGDANESSGGKFNLFWANVGVLRASLYAVPPKPMVKREFDDFADQPARVAAVMMERLLNQGFERADSSLNTAMMRSVEDRLLPGLGQVWLRYVPEIQKTEVTPDTVLKGKTVKEGIFSEQITNEFVFTDYVYWEDFWWSTARCWEEVRWVARRVWMTKKEFTTRFGARYENLVTWTKKEPSKYGERVTPDSMGVDKTEVFEIWHKPTKSVHFVSRTCPHILEEQGDPLELDDFFPCPKPLLATHTTSSMIPKADYMMVQTQYRRLDNLSVRIGMLEDAIQASGVYDKNNKELSQLLPGNGTNRMIPVDNWAMFSEKGGFKGVIDWFPLEMIVNALDKLRELKSEAKAELYELTGISDIMRGTTSPRETLGAQQLKSQYSSVRLQYVQGEVAVFIQAMLRIKAEIISKHFQPEIIVRNSLIELTPDADMAPEAVEILKDEWSSSYRIQVFADTLAIPDYNAERAGRTEFIGAMGQFVSQVTQLTAQAPELGPFLMQVLQWGVASFRSAQTIEGVFSKAVVAMNQKLQQPPPPPPPDPAMVKAQAEIKAIEARTTIEVQAKQAKTTADVLAVQAKTDADIQALQQRTTADIAATQAKTSAVVQATAIRTRAQVQASREKNAAAINAKKESK